MSAGAPLLELAGVCKRFGELTAVDSFDLEIHEGEFVTLLGPSGCGKTTLLRMIGGFEEPSEGEIRIDGVDITRVAPERRPCNMVFQSYALFPHMSVFDNVAYGLRSARRPPEEVAERVGRALAVIGMADRADVNVQVLSGGQQQRVALMRALVNEPRVLLLDEPLGALDLKLRKRLQGELRDIQRRTRTTFVYVTHDQEEALTMSHRIVVMRDGRAEQVGTPDEVYARPVSRFVADFVGETSFFEGTAAAVDGDAVEVELAHGARRRFPHYGPGSPAVGEAVLVAVRPQHVVMRQPAAGLAGVVRSRSLAGAFVTHEVELADGKVITAYTGAAEEVATGTEVGIELRDGAGVLVRSNGEAEDG